MNIKDADRIRTIENRRNLFKNKNLLFWYRQLYTSQFSAHGDLDKFVVLEIGSGTSPLKHFYPTVLTNDVFVNGKVKVYQFRELKSVPPTPMMVVL